MNHLSKRPEPLPLPTESQTAGINVTQILTLFDATEIIHGRGNSTDIRVGLGQMCDRITPPYGQAIYPDNATKRLLFCQQTTLYLKGIIQLLSDPSLNTDTKEKHLIRIAEASTKCHPTWLEEARAIYEELSTTSSQIERSIYKMVQDYKEDLIKNFVQNDIGSDWHGLNFARNVCGTELGLVDPGLDRYAGNFDPVFGQGLIKWLFLQKYENTHRLVESIKNRINISAYNIHIHTHLTDLVEAQSDKPLTRTEASSYAMETFYDTLPNYVYEINSKGVYFILQSMGFVI